jgi:thiosulfate dehydrogenase (quinone) large subunit
VNGRITAQCLAAIRIGVGLYFLSFALPKLTGDFLTGGNSLGQQLQQGLPRAEAFYQPLLNSMVLPHIGAVAALVGLGELVVGVSLTLGLLTRAGAIVGIWLNLNYMLSKGLLSPAGSVDRLFVLIELCLAIGAAGLVWGLDGTWRPWLDRIPLVSWLAGVDRPEPEPAPVEARYAPTS